MSSKFSRLLRCAPCGFSFVFGTAAFVAAFAYYFRYDLTAGNLWKSYAVAEVFFAGLNAALFWAYLAMATYRFSFYGNASKGHSWIAALGALATALVAGCPACAPTLASALGLFSVVSFFPGGWLWLKIAGAALLSYSVAKTYADLDRCALPNKKAVRG